MNEDDTFKALQRDPFRSVMVKCFRRAQLGASLLSRCDDIIEQSGWTREDINNRLNLEMRVGNITLNITKIVDPVCQEAFLATGII